MREFITQYWMEVAFSIMIGILSATMRKIWAELKCEMKDQKCIKNGVQAILRDRLIQAYNHHMQLGFCSIHDKDNISNMYKQYHSLGKNGVIDGLCDELMALPIKPYGGVEK